MYTTYRAAPSEGIRPFLLRVRALIRYVVSMHKPTVKLRTEQFEQYAEARGLSTDMEIAGHTGLDRTTVFRLRCRDISPGERVIAALLIAFPDRHFEDLFEVTTAAVRPKRRAA